MGVLNQDPNMVQNKKKINPFSNLNDLLQTNTGYGHLYADKLANLIMMNGLKPKAVATVIRCLAQLKPSKNDKDRGATKFEILEKAVSNVMPYVQVRKAKVRGTNHLVPCPMSHTQMYTKAIRWLVDGARMMKKNSKSNFDTCLASVINDAYANQGYAKVKRDELHKLAEANRSSAYYRWW